MKLYAKTTTGLRDKPVGKGSNDILEIVLSNRGVQEYYITYEDGGLVVEADGGVILKTGEETKIKGEKQKGNCSKCGDRATVENYCRNCYDRYE